LEGGRLPQAGGVRPQLTVLVDLDSLLGGPDGLGGPSGPGGSAAGMGGELGDAGLLDPEGCRRLACDGTVTRVVVTRHPSGQRHPTHGADGEVQHPVHEANSDQQPAALALGGDPQPVAHQGGEPPGSASGPVVVGLAARLRAAMTRLPPTLGGAPTQPLEVGRSTRVIQPAQRTALAVRDGGCVFPGCSRPLAWCEAHHLVHWLHGGPTDLGNLALLCRAHHRAVHEGGWRLGRDSDGRLTATPPHRRHRTAA
jgi:hypothetical protein